jgi:DNA repair protein RadC
MRPSFTRGDHLGWHRFVQSFAARRLSAAHEHLFALFLDGDGSVRAAEESEPGGCDFLDFPIRALVARALESQCASVVLSHNHPSGCPAPSHADIEQTRVLARVLLPLGIFVEDHIITARNAHFSFRAQGLV